MSRHGTGGRSSEAFFWSVFSVGGVAAALLGPGLLLTVMLFGAFGWSWFADALSYDGMRDLIQPAVVRVVVGGAVALIAMHTVHRIRHLAIDLHAPIPARLAAAAAYGGAAVLIVFTVLVLALL